MVAHRALRILRDDSGLGFLTKGDNTSHLDAPLSSGEVVGRVLAVRRGSRQMALDTVTWRTLGWLIAVGTLVWIEVSGSIRRLKQSLLGPGPSRLAGRMQGGACAFRSLVLRLVQAALGRWSG
jgi:hypothetical protein